MAKFITTKYGTKINVEGLTPEQIKKVRSVAEDKGAYGAKGAALADEFRKKAGSGKSLEEQKIRTEQEIEKRGGVESAPNYAKRLDEINAQIAGGGGAPSGQDPSATNPAVQDPGTKGTGDTYTSIDSFLEGVFKDLQPLDLSGAPKVLTNDDLSATRQSVYDSAYSLGTKNLERDRQRDLEATKQELANRGIPLDFGPDSLYARSIGSINERYDTRDLDARNAANLQADQNLSTMANVNRSAYDAFMNSATTQYESQLKAAAAASGALESLMTKYGLDRQEAQAELDRKLQDKIAKMQNKTQLAGIRARGSGSSGGAPADTGPIIGGGVAPGFNI